MHNRIGPERKISVLYASVEELELKYAPKGIPYNIIPGLALSRFAGDEFQQVWTDVHNGP
jgi:hypothetical protein